MEPFSAHNVFAMNLYNSFAMANQGQNLLLSPISIFAALSMVLPGARENTLHQMLQAMHLNSSLPMGEMEAALGKMLSAALGTGAGGSELLSANRAYIDSAFHLRPEYLSALRKHFDAESFKADFLNTPDAERLRINQWVSQMTRGKVEQLLQEGAITKETRLVLVNALCFKSNWRNQFDSTQTHDRSFEVTASSRIAVPMMEREDSWSVIRHHLLTAVQLPFEDNSRLSMFAILPAVRHQLDSVMSAMTSEDWLRVLGAPTQTERAIVRLPKAHLEGGADLKESAYLPSLGVKDLFNNRAANLSGMTQDEQLFVSGVVHKAVLKWDELGAEGAAATAVEGAGGSSFDPEPLQEINFDQPFLVVIAKEVYAEPGKSQRVPIFVGRVSNPNGK